MSASLTCFFCGDVMAGRGIDQALPSPVSPELYEGFVRDARDYVALAQSRDRPIAQPMRYEAVWGQALEELAFAEPGLRLINLETSITARGRPWPDKGVHYRMHPDNAALLNAARIDACSLANNHVLDWGREGLTDTLARLDELGITHAGAGECSEAAARPMIFNLEGGYRVLIWSLGLADSGIPAEWNAGSRRAGVWYFENASERTARSVSEAVNAEKRPGDLAVVSIHWGSNWGYDIPPEHRRLAHQLIDAGVNLIHGHSSHHPCGFERYKGQPIFYGCGDFINDYEGITGHEVFRPELTLMYFCRFDLASGKPLALWMFPLRMERFGLHRASAEDAHWLEKRLNRERGDTSPTVRMDQERRLQWL
ncbi:CapA family protein [Marinimicrobium locisalis]|uniref:CapA family protein n=1 Tax=Marinimicrobium locisalis TaxID=546022 RepID=UPI0032215170